MAVPIAVKPLAPNRGQSQALLFKFAMAGHTVVLHRFCEAFLVGPLKAIGQSPGRIFLGQGQGQQKQASAVPKSWAEVNAKESMWRSEPPPTSGAKCEGGGSTQEIFR